MAQIQFAKRLLNLKIAYYGPRGAGKAATLAALQGELYPARRSLGAVAMGEESAYTLSFQPEWLRPVRDLRVNLQLFSVPADSFERPSSHALVLQGADGVVFVADSSPDRQDANHAALARLESNLREHGESLVTTPLAFQWSKRDLPGALPVERLEAALGVEGAPGFASVPPAGTGVLEPLQAVTRAARDRIEDSLDEL